MSYVSWALACEARGALPSDALRSDGTIFVIPFLICSS